MTGSVPFLQQEWDRTEVFYLLAGNGNRIFDHEYSNGEDKL
jgi:hypothetical protein